MTIARRSTRVAALVLATAAALAAGTPGAAAPPPATHAGLVRTNPNNVTPHVLDGRPEAVLDLGSRVIVGGSFTRVRRSNGAQTVTRTHLFAYDKATGAIDTRFVPQPTGRVTSLLRAPDGRVLVGGQFKAIGGRAVPYLAKLDPTSGAVDTAFSPAVNGMVYDLHQANGLVYLGGTFTRVRGAVRTNFAVVDPTAGRPRGRDVAFGGAPRGISRVMRFDMSPDGRRLVVIGNFDRVDGQLRRNAAVLDVGGDGVPTVGRWSTDLYRSGVCGTAWDTIVYDVDVSPDGRWFVIVTTGGAGGTTRLCDTAARWEIGGTGAGGPTWRNFTGGDSLTSVAITGAAVYVAGHQRWMDNPQGRNSAGPGATSHTGIAALSTTTGRSFSWNPNRERGTRAPRLVATPQELYVVSDSTWIGGEAHPRLAFLPL